MHLSKKQEIFSDFFLHFFNLDSILIISKKKTTLRADISFNFRTPKNVVG